MSTNLPSGAQYSIDHMLQRGGGDYHIAVSLGKVAGVGYVHKDGMNPNLATTTEAVWNGGGLYTGHDAISAEVVTVSSSSPLDTTGGTGAHVVEVYGLDENWLEISEIVPLLGVTLVDTTLSFIRLNRMIVRSAGSGRKNAGVLSAAQKITTAVMFAKMPVGYNQTMIAAYTTPANTISYVHSWYTAVAKKKAGFADVRILLRPFGQVFQVKEEVTVATTGTGYIQRVYKIPKGPIMGKTDIVVEAEADAAGFGLSAGFDLEVINIKGE